MAGVDKVTLRRGASVSGLLNKLNRFRVWQPRDCFIRDGALYICNGEKIGHIVLLPEWTFTANPEGKKLCLELRPKDRSLSTLLLQANNAEDFGKWVAALNPDAWSGGKAGGSAGVGAAEKPAEVVPAVKAYGAKHRVGLQTTIFSCACIGDVDGLMDLTQSCQLGKDEQAASEGNYFDVNEEDEQGITAGHLAAYEGHTAMLVALFELSANFNVMDRNGDTPLSIAIRAEDVDTVAVLTRIGANPSLQDGAGRTPLELAMDAKDGSKAGAMISLLSMCQHPTGYVAAADILSIFDKGCKGGNAQMLEAMIEAGNIVGLQGPKKETALHYAAATPVAGIVELLLRNGAQPNAAIEGTLLTPLHSATTLHAAQSLVRNGARTALRSAQGVGAAQQAIQSIVERGVAEADEDDDDDDGVMAGPGGGSPTAAADGDAATSSASSPVPTTPLSAPTTPKAGAAPSAPTTPKAGASTPSVAGDSATAATTASPAPPPSPKRGGAAAAATAAAGGGAKDAGAMMAELCRLEAEYARKTVLDFAQDKYVPKLPLAAEHQATMGWPSVNGVLDSASTCCMICRTAFTMKTRRHHCRQCGLLVCAPCSGKKIPAVGEKSGRRACNGCFNVICYASAEKQAFGAVEEERLANRAKEEAARQAQKAKEEADRKKAGEARAAERAAEREKMAAANRRAIAERSEAQKKAQLLAEAEFNADIAREGKKLQSEAHAAAADAKLNLQKRGEKLEKLQEAMRRQQDLAQDFGSIAKQLAEKERNRKWWQ